MPSLPVILANGTALAAVGQAVESAYVLGEALSLSLQSATGYLSFAWRLTTRPVGSTATLTNSTGITSSLTTDVVGEYRIKGTAVGVDGTVSTTVAVVVVRTPGRRLRKVTAEETRSRSNLTPLVAKMNEALGEIDFTARVFNVQAYGAIGDGTTNDRAAFVAAIAAAAAAGGVVHVPTGTYLIGGSTIALPANAKLVGSSQLGSVIKIGFDGTLFTLDDDNHFAHLTFDGQGATYANSRLFAISGTKARPRWRDCALVFAGGYCLEYVDETAGSQSKMFACRVYRYNGATAGRYAIKIKDVGILTAVPRSFVDCESDGGIFADLGGCNNLFIAGGYIAGLLFSVNSRGVWANGVRLANPLGSNLAGYNHNLNGCDIAGPPGGACLTIEPGTSGCKVASTFNTADPVVDNSGNGGLNQIDIPAVTFTPTVKSSGAAVNLGAGASVRGQYSRSGAMVHLDVELTWGGAGLSVPAGFLEFSIPSSIVPRSATIQAPMGSGYAQQGATTKLLHAMALPGTAYVKAVCEGGGQMTNINPLTWAVGDVVRLSITYTL